MEEIDKLTIKVWLELRFLYGWQPTLKSLYEVIFYLKMNKLIK